jgi:2-oxoglutarate ferredoxin oxidoreductase subunit beta
MTDPTPTVTPLSSYRNDTPYPFCPGCGHGPILDSLNRALVRLGRDPARVVIVSDIGCSGLSDQYFVTSVFHGLHGRSITYATGIKLARPDLDVIVIMGDGGTGIGGTHLVSAARRNIGITVLVFNNMNFGMTGGQHSTTTPRGARTATTPAGHLERPLDVCATVGVNGAAFAYRGTSFDRDLDERIAEAITTDGFSLLDIWEMCTAYFVPMNQLTRRALLEILDRFGFATGVLHRNEAPEYSKAYRRAHEPERGKPTPAPRPIVPAFTSALDRRFSVVVAGSAGGRVRSAVRLAGRAAILSGLRAAQRDDYPITVKTGHSLAELILAPEPILHTDVTRPDALLVLTEDGRRRAAHFLGRMTADDSLFVPPAYADLETAAGRVVLDLAAVTPAVGRAQAALAWLAAAVKRLDLFPIAALEEAVRQGPAGRAEEQLQAIRAGEALAG